jgi:hypothetical protein
MRQSSIKWRLKAGGLATALKNAPFYTHTHEDNYSVGLRTGYHVQYRARLSGYSSLPTDNAQKGGLAIEIKKHLKSALQYSKKRTNPTGELAKETVPAFNIVKLICKPVCDTV